MDYSLIMTLIPWLTELQDSYVLKLIHIRMHTRKRGEDRALITQISLKYLLEGHVLPLDQTWFCVSHYLRGVNFCETWKARDIMGSGASLWSGVKAATM